MTNHPDNVAQEHAVRESDSTPLDQESERPEPSRAARLERHVAELRDLISAQTHEAEHREFSFAWLAGSMLQVLVVGLVVLALLDWLLANPGTDLITKLAFALVLQSIAHTAFSVARRPK